MVDCLLTYGPKLLAAAYISPTAGLWWNRKTIKKEVTFDGIIPIPFNSIEKKNVIDATKEEGETLDRGMRGQCIVLIHLTGNTTDVKNLGSWSRIDAGRRVLQ